MSCEWDKTEATVESFKLDGGAPTGGEMSVATGNLPEQQQVRVACRNWNKSWYDEVADYHIPGWDTIFSTETILSLFQNLICRGLPLRRHPLPEVRLGKKRHIPNK